ncbi:MAG TPA: IgGFc-binding protein, partial [Polyangiaceae bacterium]|nr:IgGFc-binding protein [Polyangiaceae bacterium]
VSGTGGSIIMDAGPCERTCSHDLHSIVDCQGNVHATCPSDQGCDPTTLTCVPACKAAEAAKATVGCDFYAFSTGWWCHAAFVANTWDSPVRIQLDLDGVPSDASPFARIPQGNGKSITYSALPGGELPPNEVAIVFLSGPKCPPGVTPAGKQSHRAQHITTSRPVVAYDVLPYGGGDSHVTSASLPIPTAAWGLNYIAVNPWPIGENTFSPQITITAAENDTEVTIKPLVDIKGGFIEQKQLPAIPANVPVTYTLQAGQTLGLSPEQELTGSPILATKRVGVWGMAHCMEIDGCCCDSAHEQLPPVSAWGSEYAAVRYRDRVDSLPESPPWRIVGAVDGTKLSYDPAPPAGAPSIVNQGEVHTLRAHDPFVVRSQDVHHPFYMASYMTGGQQFQGAGDPEFVNVIPTQQYRSEYTFFTDPTYPETNLVFVRARGSDGKFKAVDLDCFGALTGWQPVDAAGRYEYTRFDLVRFNFEPQGGCDNGRHQVSSAAPFALTVWGWGNALSYPDVLTQYGSYAYPAGSSVLPINKVQVVPR